MFSLESPHRCDSNEYTQYTVFCITKKITLNYPRSAAMEFCSKGLKNELEIAVVNEPSVLESLKFYCTIELAPVLQGVVSRIFVKSSSTCRIKSCFIK